VTRTDVLGFVGSSKVADSLKNQHLGAGRPVGWILFSFAKKRL